MTGRGDGRLFRPYVRSEDDPEIHTVLMGHI